MYVEFTKARRKHHETMSSPDSFATNRSHQQSKLVKVICLIVFGYTLTCLPRIIGYGVRTLVNIPDDHRIMCVVRYATFIVMSMNTIVDVAVYSCFDGRYQKHVKSICMNLNEHKFNAKTFRMIYMPN